jgi:hypothetical protein
MMPRLQKGSEAGGSGQSALQEEVRTMFRRFVGIDTKGKFDRSRAEKLFRLHPLELSALLELAWNFRDDDGPSEDLGRPNRRSDLTNMPSEFLDIFPIVQVNNGVDDKNPQLDDTVIWDHLIYAYMIENTRIYEIFRRVLHEFLHGEQLGDPTVEGQHWLRSTEELFYRDPPHFFSTSITSHVRPEFNATRRNAYWRMFGMDLNHGIDGNKPYPYVKGEVSNTDFVSTFEDFLREVWVGITHVSNKTGENPTDNASIANLAENLHDMLTARRESGNLSREEFFFVSMMSWLHLTIDFDSPIVKALRAEASSPEQRLFEIAKRVNLAAPKKADSFFELAEPLSSILIQIETGVYNVEDTVPALYTPAPTTGGPEADIRRIITHWSIVTGHDLKTRKVAVTA